MRALAAIALLAACGAHDDTEPDAFDLGVPPAYDCDPHHAAGTVHVRAHAFDQIVADDYAGVLGAHVVADAAGTAEIEVPACGSVTAIAADGSARLTVMMVEPGETIAPWGRAAPVAAPQLVTIAMPSAVSGATSYVASAGGHCAVSGSATTLALPVDASCIAADGTIAIAAAALNADPSATVGTPVLRVPLADALATPPVLGAFAARDAHSAYVYDGYADSSASATVTMSGVLDDRAYIAVDATSAFTDAGTVHLDVAYPELGDGALVAFVTGFEIGTRRRAVRRESLPLPALESLTAQTEMLPSIASGTVMLAGDIGIVSWFSSETSDAPVAIIALRTADPISNATITWTLALPGTASQLTLPQLPGGLESTFALADTMGVALWDASDVPNWRTARVSAPWGRSPGEKLPAGYRERASWSGIGVREWVAR